jgi:alpha-glucosidase (family GH31 glycosyl hydrolase)
MNTKFYSFKWLFLLVFIFSLPYANAQYSLDFGGDEDHVVLNGTDVQPPWSLEVMVNKSESDNYQHLLTGPNGISGIRIEQWWGVKVGFTEGGVADWTFNYQLPIGQWVHLAMTNSGTQTKLYINGSYHSTINASIDLPRKWISKGAEDASMKAKIDELRWWDVVLEDDIIEQYANEPVEPDHPNYENLLNYYKFDEGSGNICFDSKGDLDGTINGATYYIDTNHDAAVTKLVAPENNPDNYSSNEALIVRVKNMGYEDITEDFDVAYTLEGVLQETITISAGTTPLLSNQTLDIEFDPIDLNTSGTYNFQFFTSLSGDENMSNDTLTKTLVSNSNVLGNITDFSVEDNTVEISCDIPKVRVIFYKEDMFRIWLAPNGNFSNPAGDHIVVSYDFPLIDMETSDEGDYYQISSNALELRAYKNPLRFALYESDGQTMIWNETQGLDYGTRTFQYLEPSDDEYFYGGGMQNGYFSHKGNKIKISKETSNWDDGAVPNPVPFYMSTHGYGAFRNTFAPGEYDFRNTTAVSHNENRFDCFYFYGPSLKEVLNGYTELTGRPFLPPRWGLELGDADCYNAGGQSTPDVIELVADQYRENDLPGGWILPNDGYGCGYEELPYVVDELADRGFHTGLWTENGVGQIAWEVGTAGTRACKLDVAWVGAGYLNALSACKQAYNGIEENCDERGYVWSVCGWAGTQRYSIVWSGDQSGNYEYIRFHIPTFIGSGLSGYSLASSDVDGIFGGSSSTYARDLQWKTFIPVTYAMSGWASNDKHPWNYGTTITEINRKYLKLKMRLTPYMYTLCNEAYEMGVPPVRAMVLEYPDDPVTFGTKTQYQFMSGPNMLVAPVYKSSIIRDSIYFPEGKWIDYWDGTVYEGSNFLNGYIAQLETCPVFIKAGAIIPMYPEMLYDNELPKDPVTFDIYPHGSSSFEMYEDDGLSRDHRNGAYAKTIIGCMGPDFGNSGTVSIFIGESVGTYEGKPESRAYHFEVHVHGPPETVKIDNIEMAEYLTMEEWDEADEGWFYDPYEKLGIAYVKTLPKALSSSFNVEMDVLVGLEQEKIEDHISVFPNPTGGKVSITSDKYEIMNISVFDISGKIINDSITIDRRPNAVDLDLSSQANGIYILDIKTDKGRVKEKITLNN